MRSSLVRSPWPLVRSSAFFLAVLVAGSAWLSRSTAQQATSSAQEKKPATNSSPGPNQAKTAKQVEPTLEEMLNKALKDNPDIRVAEAKVREAEAELNRTRLQVTQKVLAFHHSRESQKAIIKVAEEDLQRIQKLEASKAVSQEEVKQAQQRLSTSKAKLAEIEAEMPYLLGQGNRLSLASAAFSPDGKTLYTESISGAVKGWEVEKGKLLTDQAVPNYFGTLRFDNAANANWHSSTLQPNNSITIQFAPQESGTIAEKVRKALETQVTVDYKQKTVHDILEDLKKKAPGLSIHDVSGVSQNVINMQIDGPVPLRTALQMLEDSVIVPFEGGASARLSFVLRDYGLLFAPNGNLPPDAVHINNLGRGIQLTKPEKEKPPAKDEKKPPAEEKKQ